MASNLPVVEESVIDTMFEEVSNMEVMLDRDPLEFGPKRLNEKTSITRDHLTRCEKLFGQVSQWLQLYKRAHRAGQLEFDLAMQDLLANDPEVRAGRNVADRNAIAVIKMRDSKEDLDRLQVMIQDLDAVMAVIKSKRADLKDVQSRLRDQKNLCQEEIHLGAKWGSKAFDPNEVSSSFDFSKTPVVDSVTMNELKGLMSLSDSEPDLGGVETKFVEESPFPPEEIAGTPATDNKVLNVSDLTSDSSEEDLDSLLLGIDVSPPKPDTSRDVSIDDLLGSL